MRFFHKELAATLIILGKKMFTVPAAVTTIAFGSLAAPIVGATVSPGMKLVPAGNYTMGAVPEDTFAEGDETPVHSVTFTKAYHLDSTKVTQEDYQALMHVNPSLYTASTLNPIDNVTWYDALLYCNARSKRDGWDTVYSYTSVTGTPGNGSTDLVGLTINLARNGYRLPSEALWEYACRAGTRFTYYWSDDASVAGTYAWVGQTTTHPVATKLPNAWKLYDILGNGYEWCGDFYAAYTSAAQTDPTGLLTGSNPNARAWTFSLTTTAVRCSNRKANFTPSTRADMSIRTVLPDNSVGTEKRETDFQARMQSLSGRNSFRRSLAVSFWLPASAPTDVSVYDCRGHRIAQLLTGSLSAGFHQMSWSAGNNAQGMYFVALTSDGKMLCQRIVHLN
jgi:formylglycine-generating enzyme required for sulfatase activity